MVTLTAVGEPERPLSIQERKVEAEKALQAAREAIDAAERRLEGMAGSLDSMSRVYKGYQRDDYKRAASVSKAAAMNELTEAVKHLADVVHIWWPNLTVNFYTSDAASYGFPPTPPAA